LRASNEASLELTNFPKENLKLKLIKTKTKLKMKFTDGYYSHQPLNDYSNAMDPESYGINVDNKPDVTLGIHEIGMSVPMGIAAQNIAGIYSKIRMGAGSLEIQFPGYRVGNRNQQTPEMLGEDQRQALREMQMANEVRFNTHASFGLMGMMGRDERGNYSTSGAYQDLFELKRAIDFQADMGGGSVVMHSGEFERPMTDMFMDDETHTMNLSRDESGRLLIKQAHTQEFDAKFDLMDARTSQKMETVQKDRLVAYPVWNRAKEDYRGEDTGGKSVLIKKDDYIDYQNRKIPREKIYDATEGRIPEYNKATGRFAVERKHFDYFKQEAEEYNKYLNEVELGREPNFYEKVYPEEMFLRATLETQEGHSRGWALQYGSETQNWIETLNALDDAIEYYKKLDKAIPEEEKWKIMKQDSVVSGRLGQAATLIPPETKHPLEMLEKAKSEAQKSLEFARQASASQEQQAEDTNDKKNIITPIKRLEAHGTRMYAEAGMHALRRTKDPNNPVVITIENLFPESLGSSCQNFLHIFRCPVSKVALICFAAIFSASSLLIPI